jgi:hypothetical protein
MKPLAILAAAVLLSCDRHTTADRHCNPTGTCTACKSCTHCRNCAKLHGTCSVCRPKSKP